MWVGRRVNVVATTPATEVYRARGGGVNVQIKNMGSVAVDLGGSGVTFGTGYQLGANDVVGPFEVPGGDVLYAIASSGTQSVQVLVSNARA